MSLALTDTNVSVKKESKIKAYFKSFRKPKQAKITLRQDLKKNGGLYVLVAPFFLVFTLMTVVPIIAAVCLSFTYYNLFEIPRFIGLNNYINLFLNDDIFYIALKNTMIFAIITGPIGYLMCFFMAWFLNDFNRPVRVVLTFIFFVPSLVGGQVTTIFSFFFSGDSMGMLNGFLMGLGLLREPVQWLSDPATNFTVLIIIQLWMSLGVNFLSFIAGFQNVDRSLYESGSIDGISNRFQELVYITLPQMKGNLLFASIMTITSAMAVGPISQTLCGFPSTDYSAHTIMLHLQDYATVKYEMGYACAIAVVLFIIMLVLKRLINMLLRYVSND